MWALVFWKDSRKVSVIPVEDINDGKEEENSKVAKWGKQWYSVNVLKTNENQEFLNSIEVTLDGQIIKPDRLSLVSPDLIAKKRISKQKRKATKSAKQEVAVDENWAFLKKKSIFENEDYTEKKTEYQIAHEQVTDEIDSSNEDSCKRQKLTDYNSEDRLDDMTMEDFRKLKELLELAKHVNVAEIKGLLEAKMSYDKKTLLVPEMHETYQTSISTKEVELIQGTGIFVNRRRLENIKTIYYKKPKEMVRQLMKLILTEEVLRKSSPTGKNGWKPIPENIYEGVQQFVNKNAPKKKYTLTPKRYREVLTAMCATLRTTKKKKENSNSGMQDSAKQIQHEELSFETLEHEEEEEKDNYGNELFRNIEEIERQQTLSELEKNKKNMKDSYVEEALEKIEKLQELQEHTGKEKKNKDKVRGKKSQIINEKQEKPGKKKSFGKENHA